MLIYSSSLLVYRNTVGFCISILYPMILANQFTDFRNVILDSLGFTVLIVMFSASKDSCISSCLICMLSISFSCLIALARTPVWCWRDMMIRLDTLALFLSLGKNYAVSWMVSFSSVLFIRLRKFAFISSFWKVFITSECWILLDSCICWDDRVGFFFSLFILWITLIDFLCWMPLAHLG